MFQTISVLLRKIRMGRWCCLVTLGLCLAGLSGCARMDIRGEPFPQDDLATWPGTLRQGGVEPEYFGFSNKARRIEENLGVQ